MRNRKTALMAAPAIALMALPGAALSSGGGGPEVRNAGECSGSSTSKIKVKGDDGRLQVEFEVDQNRNGRTWRVKLKDNGRVAFDGTAVTKAPSGSFSLEKRIPDRAGTDSIVATAKDRKSGERCVARASL
jgi:hypothetical protein